MPFDGRDFNRMVRQIKRGAYYEPDTPSSKSVNREQLRSNCLAASMLIRNMLRVNPDRRADIEEIASHWWLNLEENMPVIQELPENQVTNYVFEVQQKWLMRTVLHPEGDLASEVRSSGDSVQMKSLCSSGQLV